MKRYQTGSAALRLLVHGQLQESCGKDIAHLVELAVGVLGRRVILVDLGYQRSVMHMEIRDHLLVQVVVAFWRGILGDVA